MEPLSPNEPELQDEIVTHISSKQKGTITENRVSEIITLSSKGRLTCYTPNSDDDGIDLIVNPKLEYRPLFLQIKSRFILQKSGQFIQDVGENIFRANESFYILFVYFNQESLEVEKLWLVPSIEFKEKAVYLKGTRTLRFAASPKMTSGDKWAKFSIEKTELGNELLRLMQ
ncbi:hypothetical protein [Hymenobacter cheonanensis]|uniref:hypothetical protein n=1 Tax=Hymenobacter sp. CA2-7 TaxID=3063993 RepID=UPI00271404FF|nr:hypothetical protein [Hymenobacter sp. CA2-7]MDO7886266.1 hypothetical protein [Hymenobacter sp. CA2-7]